MQIKRLKINFRKSLNSSEKKKNQEHFNLHIKPQRQLKVSSFLAYATSFNLKPQKQSLTYDWQNQWKNLQLQYKSNLIKRLLYNFFLKKKLNINTFYYHKYHGGLRLVGNTFNFYNTKLSKLFKKYKRRNFQEKKNYIKHKSLKTKVLATSKPKFVNQPKHLKQYVIEDQQFIQLKLLGKAILTYTATPVVSINFTHFYLPKTYVLPKADLAFTRYKSIRNFWESLQLLRLVVENKTTAQILAKYVCVSIRRNPKRAAFIIYLKRLIDWHFSTTQNLEIQGIRLEVKGRFNAKSRSRKYILSVGRVAKQEKISNVDYAFLEAFTIFGALGIKVWICPLKKENVIATA